ncbi:SOS response-associated peptidase [Halovenus sp. WSH3]|uniref:SOS response-associated peptidase n=1 Tax=Halovenus carboxidivorans TaxID=2692199 RepID=A0A6B0SX87_9EURY|nr:SOS response-associated peptidase [Halovenus carboxidivorans]MXR50184.1 SOS response-associated peptidase [Halovenus carboxidivorans]
MCGRYTLFVAPETLSDRFGIDVEAYEPTYNAAPGQQLPVITDDEPGRLRRLEWGLVPQWAEAKTDGGHINARAETLAEKSSFADAFEGEIEGAGRCLVPADGFYEWVETDQGSQPYRVTFTDGRPFLMAGLWTRWQPPTTQTGLDAFGDGAASPEAEPVETFTIVTTEPNDLVSDLHHRMAVILPDDQRERWLSASPDSAEKLLEPHPAESMHAYPVSTAVNDPANDHAELVDAVDSPAATGSTE